MTDNNLIYKVNESPKTFKEWVLYSMQQVLAVIVATLLIPRICGTPASACLIGACIGTCIYQLFTKSRSPMFISSCGATCSAVIGALALPGIAAQNYLMVAVGGAITMLVYLVFAVIVRCGGVDKLNKIFPITIVGPVTMVIGLNLATFMISYTHNSNTWEVAVAIATMLVIAISSHYFKGFLKTIPFLIGLAFGYVVSVILTITNISPLIDFSVFDPNTWQWYPELTFFKWHAGDFSWSNLIQVIILFVPVSICALLEHYSDHKCLSNIVGEDLTTNPGLHRTLIGDGVASFVGTVVCGLPNTSYGESIACVGFSKVASVSVITISALILGLLSFIAPVTAFVSSIPSSVFCGCAFILTAI